MISLEQLLDEDRRPYYKITCPSKTKQCFVVQKTEDGFSTYHVKVKGFGSLPKVLMGTYTRAQFAIDDVKKYLEKSSVSPTVQSDIRAAERAKEKEEAAN